LMRLGHRKSPFGLDGVQESSARQENSRSATLPDCDANSARLGSGRRVDSSQLAFDRSYIALAKSPLAAFLEGRNNITPRKFVHRVRAQVEQERDFAGIQQYVVFIGHASPTRRLTSGILSGRDFVVCACRRSQGKRRRVPEKSADSSGSLFSKASRRYAKRLLKTQFTSFSFINSH